MGKNTPKHIAIIMDGNRRWAKKRGLPGYEGHKEGTETLEKIVEAAGKMGIETLTVYALSTENLTGRSREEISMLFRIVRDGFKTKIKRMMENGVKVEIIGELEGLPRFIKDIILKTNDFDVDKQKIKLNIAFNYGGKREILVAIQKMLKDGVSPDEVTEESLRERLYNPAENDPELVIRTGGNVRLSNFLLWQTGYSELYFTETLWPDFDEKKLQSAINWYNKQQRNFGS